MECFPLGLVLVMEDRPNEFSYIRKIKNKPLHHKYSISFAVVCSRVPIVLNIPSEL